MKDTIYTIPLTDAFKTDDECPFCVIHRKLENDAIAFTLGASYMEDDFRALTDQSGFCETHYKKLYDYGNRLGLALILHTHYQALYKDVEASLNGLTLPSPSFFQKLKKKPIGADEQQHTYSHLQKKMDSCFICNRIEKDMERYIKTFFYLITTNNDFKELFNNSKGFCLKHFTQLLEAAPYHLKEEEKNYFLNTSKDMLLTSLKRIEEDLSWFIDKNDYRYSKEPWKNAQDAIPRAIQKVSGCCPHLQPLKESK